MSYYWPREVTGVAVYGKLKVTLLSEEPQEDYIIRKLELREDTQYHIPVRFLFLAFQRCGLKVK